MLILFLFANMVLGSPLAENNSSQLHPQTHAVLFGVTPLHQNCQKLLVNQIEQALQKISETAKD